MDRLILLTGKGGVGKTSLAAAHAVASARQGRQTMLASMDAAHNLSDLFGCEPAPAPVEIAPRLDITEVDPGQVREEFADLNAALAGLIVSEDTEDVIDLPGLDPLFFLLRVQQLAESGDYDRIVLDLAPTGETLSLLQLPEMLSWWMERVFPVQKLALRALRPVAQPLWHIQLPNRRAMNDVERLYQRLQDMQLLLKNPGLASVRLVTLPERMVIEETRRSYLYLNLFGYSVDQVFVNGVLPDQVDGFFRGWVEHQREHLTEIEDAFGHLPLTRVPRFASDLLGLDDISRLAEVALDEHAFDVRENLAHEQYLKVDAGYDLRLMLPAAMSEQVHLTQTGADLSVRIGGFRRSITLPDSLRHHDVTSARLRDGVLTIQLRLPQKVQP